MIYLAITIDTECDKGFKWAVKQPLQFSNIKEGVVKTLQPLFNTFGAKPTYLLSPEVIDDEECVDIFKNYLNIELGTHLHAEFIHPFSTFHTDTTKAFQSAYSPEIEYQKLENLTNLFFNAFGYRPISFRAGRFGLSLFTLKYLDKLGYRVDCSVTPGMWWMQNKNHGVNFFAAPLQPYHPAADNFCAAGSLKILEIPITIIQPDMFFLPNKFKRLIDPTNKIQRRLLTLLAGKKIRNIWLRPTYSTSEEMLQICDYMQKEIPNTDIILCMIFHSNEFTAGTSPYSLSEKDVEKFKQRLYDYLAAMSQRDVIFHRLSEMSELK